jgi:hypothetical protein
VHVTQLPKSAWILLFILYVSSNLSGANYGVLLEIFGLQSFSMLYSLTYNSHVDLPCHHLGTDFAAQFSRHWQYPIGRE